MCHFKNLHRNHKVREIKEGEFKKESIKKNVEYKGLNDVIKNCNNLKEKLLNEMKNVDESYKKRNDEITNSFQMKHENLIKKENDLKENLKNEVTKIKEKLEYWFSESNNVIQKIERLKKLIELFEKEEKEQNIFQYLTYLSLFNKKKNEVKEMEKFL